MKQEVLQFYSDLRQIFGVCPHCVTIFRLCDSKLYQKHKPLVDWKEKIDKELDQLSALEVKIKEKIRIERESAREKGRLNADKLVSKIDPIFSPLKLNPNDAKVIFHPVDFIVFKGMNNNLNITGIKEIILIDKTKKGKTNLTTQRSIEKAIDKKSYEWLTLRVENNGNIIEE